VQPAAGDAGGAIGAAYSVWRKLNGGRFFVMSDGFWGPQFGQAEIRAAIEEGAEEIRAAGCTVMEIGDEAVLCRTAAEEIAEGKVVGWFQGRMEWGPRALGHRSILCDPRRADMRAIVNARIKHRESFRPFSPSVLFSSVSEWFEEDDAEPFMMRVFQVREPKRHLIPAVTHVDGSARLQTVYQHRNERFFHLIEAFRDITGVPMVLNTSFNEREPIVCDPKEALDCFLRTKMDLLVLENTMITRRQVPKAQSADR
jgi:carbamoyltransferase